MDGDWESEGNLPSLTCRIIQAFGDPKSLEWGGLIRWIIPLLRSNMVRWFIETEVEENRMAKKIRRSEVGRDLPPQRRPAKLPVYPRG